MDDTVDRRIVLAQRPQGAPRESDFRLETGAIPVLGAGRVLARNRLIAVGPGLLGRLTATASHAAPIALGGVIEGATVAEVLASNSPDFAVGDQVVTNSGWREHAVEDAAALRKIEDRRLPASAHLGLLGSPGLTAYFGMLALGAPKPGERVLVSSAAGPVGSAAGQIAAIAGARVVGIAGGAAKCAWLTDELGFSRAIDRKAETDLAAAIAKACPEGIDVLFDSVGATLIDAVLPLMRVGGRIVAVGQLGDAQGGGAGLTHMEYFITRRLTLRGLGVYDHAARFAEARADLAGWVEDGRLKGRDDIEDGLERLPSAFVGLFKGDNFGRKLIRLGGVRRPRPRQYKAWEIPFQPA